MQRKEEQLQVGLLPNQQDEPGDQQHVSYIMVSVSLPLSKSPIRVSLAAHPNMKHMWQGILGNVVQSRQVDTLQSYHIPHSLFYVC